MAGNRPREFVHDQGPAFLAHLLRRMSDAIVDGCAEWHPEQGLATHPRTSSTLLALDERGSLTVTEISGLLRQSHPLVIQWVRQLKQLGLVAAAKDPHDNRRSLLSLTPKGRAAVRRLRQVLAPVERAMTSLMDEAAPGLFEALWKMEGLLRARPFIDRLRAEDAAAAAGARSRGA